MTHATDYRLTDASYARTHEPASTLTARYVPVQPIQHVQDWYAWTMRGFSYGPSPFAAQAPVAQSKAGVG